MVSTLQRLMHWYQSNCDGDWEHTYGVEIATLDNPGWRLKIDLKDTSLQHVPFETHEDRFGDKTEWLRCWKEDLSFQAACGSFRLEDALVVFLSCAEGQAKNTTNSSYPCNQPDTRHALVLCKAVLLRCVQVVTNDKLTAFGSPLIGGAR
jgi:hypothetical protein